MAEEKMMRLSQVARKLNVGLSTIIDFLETKGFEVEGKPTTKIPYEQFVLLAKEFESSALDKEEASELVIGGKHTEDIVIKASQTEPKKSKKEEEEEERIMIKDNSADLSNDTPAAPKDKPEDKSESKKDTPSKNKEEKEEKPAIKEEAGKVASPKLEGIKVVGKIDLEANKPKKAKAATAKPEKKVEKIEDKAQEKPKKEEKETKKESPKATEEKTKVEKTTEKPTKAPEKTAPEPQKVQTGTTQLKGLTVLGKIELPKEKKPKPVASSDERENRNKKKKRKRITKPDPRKKKRIVKEEPTDQEIQDKIKATLEKLSGKGKKTANRAKYRKEKRDAVADAQEEQMMKDAEESSKLKVTEFISASDLASLMNVTVNDVISTCMGLGMFVSINQRLDAESITFITDEFGFEVEFTSEEEDEKVNVIDESDKDEDLKNRAPIVTIMGHVDHGKTSLLDFIRDSSIAEAEAGGITQHIGAYDVTTNSGKRIAFLDTPGHEAFTAMRARGARITDVAIIVVAADDNVMPQTKEAINHAQVAGVPIVFAINKVDKPNANPDKIKEALSAMNILVEEWGGKYQSQDISAKTGAGIDELLEKVLLEAEMLELKANPDKPGIGTVVEAELDKGRGYVTTILVQAGTIKIGDVMLAGSNFGKIKALFDHRGKELQEVGPSTPVLVLGLDGAPQAGDKFNIMATDKEARELAVKRAQIQREQSLRTKKHITLDEIGRRLAIGSFKELNVILKGDVDGSIEALSDSLQKLSTEEIQVNIISKAVGQISESDVLLASASDAVIIGFQVRPSVNARKLAEAEEIDIRTYSIIYDAINELKDAMEGLLAPTVEEFILGNIEIRDVFKISKVGTVAGCYVVDGMIKRNSKIRLLRDGVIVHTGEILQLRRFKDDVAEVKNNYECGISIKDFNDLKVDDMIEAYEEREIKRKL